MERLAGDGGMPGAWREFPGRDASQNDQIDHHPRFTRLEPPAESWPFQGHESNLAAVMVRLELPQIIRIPFFDAPWFTENCFWDVFTFSEFAPSWTVVNTILGYAFATCSTLLTDLSTQGHGYGAPRAKSDCYPRTGIVVPEGCYPWLRFLVNFFLARKQG
ncbi:MAG: hypothetical protein NTW03_11660, partial [Verrucomicrobia bacterium]|nr:hypothetical protein [Verrucomicrobiota bacterium]